MAVSTAPKTIPNFNELAFVFISLNPSAAPTGLDSSLRIPRPYGLGYRYFAPAALGSSLT